MVEHVEHEIVGAIHIPDLNLAEARSGESILKMASGEIPIYHLLLAGGRDGDAEPSQGRDSVYDVPIH